MIKPPVVTPEKIYHRIKPPRLKFRISRRGLVILLALNTCILAFFAFPMVNGEMQALSTPITTITPASGTSFETPTSPTTLEILIQASPTTEPLNDLRNFPQPVYPLIHPLPEEPSITPGTVFLSMDDGTFSHLFAYQPQTLPITRLTYGPWEDITPTLNPGGDLLAFSSNRNGYWNLYLLDLKNGQVRQLTDNHQYEASPSWSPDGRWLVYEAYLGEDDGGLELFILPIDNSSPPIRLTEHPAANFSPSWSPLGRHIAFVSVRSGKPDIWIADLDTAGEERFYQVTRSTSILFSRPVWSPDGKKLAWSADENGYHNLYVWNIGEDLDTRDSTLFAGSGNYPVWSPEGDSILTLLVEPNETYLTAYFLKEPSLALPPVALSGSVNGLSWGILNRQVSLPGPFEVLAAQTPTPAWQPALTLVDDAIPGRYTLSQLIDVSAPYPKLHDLVDEAFDALRLRIAYEAGWDYLSTLENAYLPVTSPSVPGMKEDWLYTGRAFAANSLPYNGGWMVIVREDSAYQTYWRVYLKARAQDGSAGRPIYHQPWDFNARYSGNMDAYENGGERTLNIPAGYWVDFTQIARRFDWKRLPALTIWRTNYPSARFNHFMLDSGLDWKSAMLEIYPSEVLITPTQVIPPTRTPSPTPRWYQSPTPTITSSPRPTLTPPPPTPTDIPTLTPTPTPSPTITMTPTRTESSSAVPSQTPIRSR
jgi:TolB protein